MNSVQLQNYYENERQLHNEISLTQAEYANLADLLPNDAKDLQCVSTYNNAVEDIYPQDIIYYITVGHSLPYMIIKTERLGSSQITPKVSYATNEFTLKSLTNIRERSFEI